MDSGIALERPRAFREAGTGNRAERYVQTPESSVGHSQVIETPGYAVRIFRRYGDCQSSLLKMDALMRLPGCEVALAKAAQGSCFTLGSRIAV
jgi:hypothetical protein